MTGKKTKTMNTGGSKFSKKKIISCDCTPTKLHIESQLFHITAGASGQYSDSPGMSEYKSQIPLENLWTYLSMAVHRRFSFSLTELV